MATRTAVNDDLEMESLRNGDVAGARAVVRRKQIEAEEERAVDTFMVSHPELMDVFANRSLLLTAARSFGAVVTIPLLELALIKIGASLAMTPPVLPEPTAAEVAAAEKKRLWSMSIDELRQEAKSQRRNFLAADEIVSPELLAMTSRADIDRLSAAQLRRFMYREGSGVARIGNIRRINELLRQGI